MRTLGRYTLLQRIELGMATENWLAFGPGAGGVPEAVTVARVLPTLREEPWVDVQLDRARKAARLPAPWPKTHFVGREAGEAVHVQEYKGGVRLSEILRDGGLDHGLAVRMAIELCDALEHAQHLPSPALGLDDRTLVIGWDGQFQLSGFGLDQLPPLDDTQANPVFRVCLVLSRMLRGHSIPMTRSMRPPALELWPGQLAPHQDMAGVAPELARVIEKNLGLKREATCAGLKRALTPFAMPRDEALRMLSERLQSGFVIERSIDLARRGMCGMEALEPLPNDHVAKVHGGRDDEGDWLVLGDWFQGQSHPRGKLIALQMRGDASDDANERAMLAREAKDLVDGTAELRVPRGGLNVKLRWRWGYVEAAELPELETVEGLALFLAHPSMRFLEELTFARGDVDRIAMLLAEVSPPATLKVLWLPRLTRAAVAAAKQAWPALGRIERAHIDDDRPAHEFFE